MGFNKGEWSELYSFLYLLENPNLIIVDENLQIIEQNLFKILEIAIIIKLTILKLLKYQIIIQKSMI